MLVVVEGRGVVARVVTLTTVLGPVWWRALALVLTRTRGDLLRHLGSPFAPDNRPTQTQAHAA